jgi:UTP--glucose-1-phosphate uridylyltransferase
MNAQPAIEKMQKHGIPVTARACFKHNFNLWASKAATLIPEASIQTVDELPTYERILSEITPDPELLNHTAVLKLNGGLGTGMGLEKAKSLLEVRKGVTFLDLIGRQILHLRQQTGTNIRFLLLNSFSTSVDTREWLSRNPDLGDARHIELLQNKIPKIEAATGEPVTWPENPDLEWCPPGHGDLYTVLGSDGLISKLRGSGVEYIFVSNSDNLGAWLDPVLLAWFAKSGAPFLMEVTARTPSDRKGGHLARNDQGLLLRESAQCPEADVEAFQDIEKHRFFNTNNLWLRLDRIEEALATQGGFLPLPVIANSKTVDPRDSKSTTVIQLETAMGAAIGCFPDAAAIEVPRSRFAPVKTTADLLALRSDAYTIQPDGRVALLPSLRGVPPKIELDGNYKLVDALEEAIAQGTPSLKNCSSLQIKGKVRFHPGTEFLGDVKIVNGSPQTAECTAAKYENLTVVL